MEDKDAVCVWEKGHNIVCGDTDVWKTECGKEWLLVVGDWDLIPTDFGYNFCPACGRRINILGEPRGDN